MENRKLPFGYHIQDGQIHVAEHEAEVVRIIFTRYVEQPSYDKLAAELNGQGVPYLPGKRWNKNMAARILRDGRYLGGSTYPQIITSEAFQRVQAAKPGVSGKIDRPESKDIRILARCGLCHQPMRRERKDHWHCPSCVDSFAKVKDDSLIMSVEQQLRRLHSQPDTISLSPAPDVESETIQNTQDKFIHEMDKPVFDEDTAKAAALALASARFDALGSEDYEAMQMRHTLDHAEQTDGLDTELLRQIAKAILIYPSGAVSLQLKNGQIVKGSEGT